MMRIIYSLALVVFIFCVSCSDNVDNDAKKAAELVSKSMNETIEHNLDAASEYYQQYQEIQSKYKDTNKYKEFEEAYWKYTSKEKQ